MNGFVEWSQEKCLRDPPGATSEFGTKKVVRACSPGIWARYFHEEARSGKTNGAR
jgi:hypothetical protein